MIYRVFASKSVHVLIFRNCEYVKLYGKREFTDSLKFADGSKIASHLTLRRRLFLCTGVNLI